MPLVGAGRALETGDRTRLELLNGQSLASVRVHSDPDGARAARALHARAFSFGEHLCLRRGRVPPRRPRRRAPARTRGRARAPRAVRANAAAGDRTGRLGGRAQGRVARGDAVRWAVGASRLRLVGTCVAAEPSEHHERWEAGVARRDLRRSEQRRAQRTFVSRRAAPRPTQALGVDWRMRSRSDVRGADAPQMQFLQFYWIELTATIGRPGTCSSKARFRRPPRGPASS